MLDLHYASSVVMLLVSPSPHPFATFRVRFQNFLLHPSQAPPSHSFMYQASKSHSAPSSKIFFMQDAFSDRKLLRRSKKFFIRLRKILRLGSSMTLSCGATHIAVSRKLCYTMCLCTSEPFSFSFYR